MYRLWDPERNLAFKSRDVEFQETQFFDSEVFKEISRNFSPLQIEFTDINDEPEHVDDLSPFVSNSDADAHTSNGFITPKHPAKPLHRSSSHSSTSTSNRYLPLSDSTDPDISESDDDSDDDLPLNVEHSNAEHPNAEPLDTEPPNAEHSNADPVPTTIDRPTRTRNPSQKAIESARMEAYFKRQSKARSNAITSNSAPKFNVPVEPTSETSDFSYLSLFINYHNFKQLQATIIIKSGNDSCLKLLEVAIVVIVEVFVS